MSLLITVLVTFFAGMGAGLGTGFAGMSAAAVISPMLITFLDMDPYMAVGIALSSDVLASAISAYTYGKNKNLDIKNGIIMMISVLAFTVVGSYVSSLVPSTTMGGFSVFMTFILGIKFIVRPVMTTKEAMAGVSAKKRALQSVICGVLIGFICGFIGAGGGMMMLLILTSVLGYELKTAVGTSVFIVAMSIVFSRVLSISTGFVRFNLGSLPVLLAAVVFGPGAGFAVGAVADIIGGVLAGYAINPLITLGAGAIGLVAGFAWQKLSSLSTNLRLAASVLLGHFVGSMVITSLALRLFYGYPWATLAVRIPNALILSAVNVVLLRILLENRSLMKLAKK